MVTPDKTTKFDDYFSSSNGSPVSTSTRSRKKRGGWSRNQTTENTDKKVQGSLAIVKKQKVVRITIPAEQKKDVVQKQQPVSQEDKKTKDISTPVLVDSNVSSSETISTASNQLFAKIADIVEGRLPKDQDSEATQILKQSDEQILNWFVTLVDSRKPDKEQSSVPSIDPKLYEELQATNAELRSEVQKQSTAVSSLKSVLTLREKDNKELQHKTNQAKLHILTLSQSVKKLSPTDDTQVGDTITPEYILQTTENLSKEVAQLEVLYGLSCEHSLDDLSKVKQKSSSETALESNIPTHKDVIKLFKKASVLHSKCELEVQKLDTKDKRPPQDIYDSFVSMLEGAQSLANSCMEIKAELVKDIDQVQKNITKNTVPKFDQDQRRGVEIVSQFYSERQFSEDIQRHSIQHNQMRADLKDVVSHHEKVVEMLSNIAHNIGVVLMDWEDDKFYDTMMEIQSTLNKLTIDIQSIVIPEVKESVIKGAFKHNYEGIVTFKAMSRKKRKVLMGLTVPSEEPLKQLHIDSIKHLANVEKKHLQELAKTWNKIAPHVEIRMQELEKKVAEGNQNVRLSASALQTVANYESTTSDAYEQNKILPYETDHEEHKKTLHQLKKDLEDLQSEADLAKQEANRTYDAFKREGNWTTEGWWLKRGYHDEEVTKLFTKEQEEVSAGWRIW